MCRLRTQESASQGVDGGLNMNFLLEGHKAGVPEADVVLSSSQDPRYANLMAVASPFSPGAFRFEGAYWSGHYLTFRAPSTLRMASLVNEEKDITDFVLVDYSAMYKYMTMDEILAPAVECGGGGRDYVKLSDLRADMSVRMYFQNTLGCAVWNNKDFEAYFEGHYDLWDFDAKHARVRARPKDQQLAKRLEKAERQSEVAQVVLCAGEELCEMPVGIVTQTLSKLGDPLPKGRNAALRRDVGVARQRLLVAVPSVCNHRAEAGDALQPLLHLHRAVVAVAAAALGSDDDDEEDTEDIPKVRDAAQAALCELISERVRRVPGEVQYVLLSEVLELPLAWEVCAEPLRAVVPALLPGTWPAGSLLQPLRAATRGGEQTMLVSEALAQWELGVMAMAPGNVAAEVLIAMIEGGVLVDEAAARLQPPILTRLPLLDVVRLVAMLGERGCDGEPLKPALLHLASAPGLLDVPAPLLLRLAVVATKSAVIAECALGPVAAAAAATLGDWLLDDVTKLLLAVAKSRASAPSEGVERLLQQATPVVKPRLPDLSAQQLLKTVLAIGS
eukprot:CAMPEP_0179031962 /NCGR_PEP_ID=MMETSP0796-20121207/11338_1 /TAXON_ID=73915 /ORGANISM="Pyrodinium bahamense, Strain pbaha01" /LENGTH=559 /DNA_ID=CAMNT_0020728165 /DNA_START=174 /DNA_END=1850 /DNA_ORIENTATION=+